MGIQEQPVCFGQHYAILHLDWTTLMCGIDDSPRGKSMVESCIKWNDAIHAKAERPLTIFTTLAFRRGAHELAPNSPFAKLVARFGSFEEGSPAAEIDPRFQRDGQDVVLHKSRWSATSGSNLTQILRAKGIDTVVIVSGVDQDGVAAQSMLIFSSPD
ncbi:hypothetical protein PWT90_05724 [Aphanocladium album]|nr:hypothetical protein PWT90_05724 [Aphanocladium album]